MAMRFIVDREMARGEHPLMPHRRLPSVIWNPETNKPLIEFKNGIYETSSSEEIALLKRMGYMSVDLEVFEEPETQEKKRTTRKLAE